MSRPASETARARFASAPSAMDVPRPDLARKRRRRRILWGATTVLALAGITWGLARLEPAAPLVEQAWMDTVRRGEMLRQVRGHGLLVPEQIQFVQADTEGRVERILVQPGAEVEPDTVLLELSNPELAQAGFDAEWALKGAEAQLARLKTSLESERLSHQAALATLKAEHAQAVLEAEADETLAREGLVPEITRRRSRSKADDYAQRVAIDERRLAFAGESIASQIAVQQAEVEKMRAALELKRRQVANLHVRAGILGVLQQTGDAAPLQVGQRVGPAATLAKVVVPTRLKAEIRVPETQAKDVTRGQPALVDTRNGVVPGRVVRVDPAVQNGSVLVEVRLEGPLPSGARPDLSVEGTIELERLTDVVHVGKPVQGQANSRVGLFRLTADRRHAVRVPVELGRASVTTIEVVSGLQPGDQVILSDMSQWDSHDRVRLK
ncbi:MAG TPA: efflux RND transporter periplasmic adaptor subunit [Verrucomicrobiota bacterium]|nr:efflux RND transporter periplasmic adaptor subunit [Verrucomicrobiota bacterium]